jgi:MFS family permease
MLATAPGRAVGSALWLLLAGFVLFGVVVGTQGVLWVELMHALGLGAGPFGTAQLLPPLVAIAVLLAGGSLSARVGTKVLTGISLVLLAGSLLGLAAAAGLAGFLGALAVQGGAIGLLELALNGAVLDWERVTGESRMNLVHAGFSGGAVAGAIGAGVLLEAGWSYGTVLALLAALAGLVLAATPPVTFPPAAADPERARPSRALGLLRIPAVRALALVAVLGIVGESVANTWSVIHLRELGAPALVGGSAFALFNGAMAAGRLANGAVVRRWGARRSLLASAAGMVVAGLLLVVPAGLPLAVAGFVLLGLSVAGIVPTVLSAAAERDPRVSGAVTGTLLAVGYAGFVVAPPVIGWLAEATSLQAALACVGVAGLGALALARRLPPVEARARRAASR